VIDHIHKDDLAAALEVAKLVELEGTVGKLLARARRHHPEKSRKKGQPETDPYKFFPTTTAVARC
jgi:hypothetical protein